jgi:hypothetical protein
MPRLSRYFIRSALICFGLGFTAAALGLAAKGGTVSPSFWVWRAPHIALLLNGWLIQLAMGVAYWIFPRILLADRGRPGWAWAAFFVFQVGVGLNLLAFLQIWWGDASDLLAPGVGLQAFGIGLYLIHLGPRVRAAFIRQHEATPATE